MPSAILAIRKSYLYVQARVGANDMKFAKVSYRPRNCSKPVKYGWMVMVRNTLDLLDYFEKYNSSDVRAAYAELAEYLVPKSTGLTLRQHLRNHLAQSIILLAEIRRQSIVDVCAHLGSGKFGSMARNLPVYVNANGGWMPSSERITHVRVVESDRWPTDEETSPRYIQWPGGAHWYCKVGAEDVVVDGQQKWPSKKAAQRAFRKWLAKADESPR